MADDQVADPHKLSNEEIDRLMAAHDRCVEYFEKQLAHSSELSTADKTAVMNVFWSLLSLVEEHPSPPLVQIMRRVSADLQSQRESILWSLPACVDERNLGSLKARRLRALEVVRAYSRLEFPTVLLETLAGIDGCFAPDKSFNALTVDVAALLECYDESPKGKNGKRGAESILAELCWECEGLGFKRVSERDPDETRDDGIDRIRLQLSKEWREFEAGANAQSEQPEQAAQEKRSKNNPASKRL